MLGLTGTGAAEPPRKGGSPAAERHTRAGSTSTAHPASGGRS